MDNARIHAKRSVVIVRILANTRSFFTSVCNMQPRHSLFPHPHHDSHQATSDVSHSTSSNTILASTTTNNNNDNSGTSYIIANCTESGASIGLCRARNASQCRRDERIANCTGSIFDTTHCISTRATTICSSHNATRTRSQSRAPNAIIHFDHFTHTPFHQQQQWRLQQK